MGAPLRDGITARKFQTGNVSLAVNECIQPNRFQLARNYWPAQARTDDLLKKDCIQGHPRMIEIYKPLPTTKYIRPPQAQPSPTDLGALSLSAMTIAVGSPGLIGIVGAAEASLALRTPAGAGAGQDARRLRRGAVGTRVETAAVGLAAHHFAAVAVGVDGNGCRKCEDDGGKLHCVWQCIGIAWDLCRAFNGHLVYFIACSLGHDVQCD